MGVFEIFIIMNYSYDINDYECVGDALGKINYNFLNLEAQICSLSSKYFDSGYLTAFDKLSSIMTDMNIIGNQFYQVPLYKQAYTVTNLLSSYWNKTNITIEYPINIETVLYNTGLTTQNYHISGVATDQILLQKAKNFIIQKFSSEDLLNTMTYVNVCFLIYSSNGEYLPTTVGPFSAPPNMKYWNITLRKKDLCVSYIRTFRFEKVSDQWVNISIS